MREGEERRRGKEREKRSWEGEKEGKRGEEGRVREGEVRRRGKRGGMQIRGHQ